MVRQRTRTENQRMDEHCNEQPRTRLEERSNQTKRREQDFVKMNCKNTKQNDKNDYDDKDDNNFFYGADHKWQNIVEIGNEICLFKVMNGEP